MQEQAAALCLLESPAQITQLQEMQPSCCSSLGHSGACQLMMLGRSLGWARREMSLLPELS